MITADGVMRGAKPVQLKGITDKARKGRSGEIPRAWVARDSRGRPRAALTSATVRARARPRKGLREARRGGAERTGGGRDGMFWAVHWRSAGGMRAGREGGLQGGDGGDMRTAEGHALRGPPLPHSTLRPPSNRRWHSPSPKARPGSGLGVNGEPSGVAFVRVGLRVPLPAS